ncbi:hypothetical protein Tco_0569407 [Tanacetum coccineum]
MMMNLGTPTPKPLVNSFVYEESDDDIEVTHVYTPPLPFLTTIEPKNTLLMGNEDSCTTPTRETDKFIKSSANDLIPIPRESEVTSSNNLEFDMLVTILLPTIDVKEENFDINSPLGEHVVDFLMENEDIADLPRHLVKQLSSYLVKHPSSTKRMSDEPLGNTDSVSRSLETSDLNLEELTADIDLDDSIPTEIDDGYYNSEGDILFLEYLLIEETFFDPTHAVLPKKSTLLITPLLNSEHIFLREVERFNPFFSLTWSGGKTRVMETPSFGFHHMPSPRPAAYSSKQVMYRYYHPHLTLGDGFDHEIKTVISFKLGLGIVKIEDDELPIVGLVIPLEFRLETSRIRFELGAVLILSTSAPRGCHVVTRGCQVSKWVPPADVDAT